MPAGSIDAPPSPPPHPLPLCNSKNAYQPTLLVVTWNVRGLYRKLTGESQSGLLQELTTIMDNHNIDVLLLQETYVMGSPSYHTKNGRFLVTLSGAEPDPLQPGLRSQAGVGAILNRKAQDAMHSVTPLNDRHMILRFHTEGTQTTLHNLYAPHNDRPDAERALFYQHLKTKLGNLTGTPTYLIGDWNARLHRCLPGEEGVLGPSLYGRRNWLPASRQWGALGGLTPSNRALLMDLATENELTVSNSWFPKPAHKQVTFKSPGPHGKFAHPLDNHGNPTIVANTTHIQEFAQLDLCLVPRNWKSTVVNIESRRDVLAKGADHFPVFITLAINLAASHPCKSTPKPNLTGLGPRGSQATRLTAKDAWLRTLQTGLDNIQATPDPAEHVDQTWKAWHRASHQALAALGSVDKPPRQAKTSQRTLTLIEERNNAERHGPPTEYERLRRAVTRSVRKDNRVHLKRCLEGGDWDSIMKHRKGFTPQPTRLKDAAGEVVASNQWAETLATYYATHQWQAPSQGPRRYRAPIFPVSNDIPTGDFTMAELLKALKLLKSRKATGPDDIPNELWKSLTIDAQQNKTALDAQEHATTEALQAHLLDLVNYVHRHHVMPDSWNDARIAAIFKGGDSSNPDRYRPIALLNTAYKIYTRLIQIRLSHGLESRLRKQQFGFRPGHSGSEAIFLLRRTLDLLLSNDHENEIHLILLDWSKAFDKLAHPALYEALQRLGVPTAIIADIEMMYRAPQFYVQKGQSKSAAHQLRSGVRQGCPLSPYLFIAWMSVMLHDVDHDMAQQGYASSTTQWHNALNLHGNLPLPLADLEYADDTILIATMLQQAQAHLHAVQTRSEEDNMTLNATKSEHLCVRGGAGAAIQDVHGTVIPRKTRTTYLGSEVDTDLLRKNRSQAEVTRRLAMAHKAYQGLQAVWSHANIKLTRKVCLYRACVVSKLTYALHTFVISTTDQGRLNTFHLRCLRKIHNIATTYASKKVLHTTAVPNAEVYKRARDCPLMAYIENTQIRHYAHVVRADRRNHTRLISINPTAVSKPPRWKGPPRRGRPVKAWVTQVYELAKEAYRYSTPYDDDSDAQLLLFLQDAARVRKATEIRLAFIRHAYQNELTPQAQWEAARARKQQLIRMDSDRTHTVSHVYVGHPIPDLRDSPPHSWWPNPLYKDPAKLTRPQPPTQAQTYYVDGSFTKPKRPAAPAVGPATPPIAGWGLVHFNRHALTLESAGTVLTTPTNPDWLGARVKSNNTAEMTAMCQVLKHAITHHPTAHIDIRYDSSYTARIAQGLTTPTKNIEIAQSLRFLATHFERRGHLTFTHVRAHKGEWWNERVDALANHGATLWA